MTRYCEGVKWGMRIMLIAIIMLAAYAGIPLVAQAAEQTDAEIGDGVTTISESVSDKIYDVSGNRAVAIKGSTGDLPSVIIENCTFNISGSTMRIDGSGVGYNGETMTKLGIGGNVIFRNTNINVEGGSTNSSSGNDAAITMFDGNIGFEDGTIDVENWKGQGIGLYGKADVEFKNSTLKNTGNKNGWCYAMYGSSVMTLDNTDMSATGMTIEKGNTNAFYSGDSLANYDALYIKNGSTVDFHDNKAGGFAINNVNIYVEDSSINISDNAGNASNSGKWFVKNSELTIKGNRSGHGWSHHSDNVTDSKVEILHNGYSGYHIRGDSTWKDSSIKISCNGERLKTYSGGDLWLNGNTLTIDNCGEVWLGAAGKAGKVVTLGNTGLIGYDIHESGTKGNSSAVLTEANVINNDMEKNGHVLFLNPWMSVKYARGIDDSSDDTDLFKDKNSQTLADSQSQTGDDSQTLALNENQEYSTDIIGKDKAKIGRMTDAQLAHHIYDWDNGEVLQHANPDVYGIQAFKCKACDEFVNHTESHINSFDCPETYVYAPLVGVLFIMNTGDDSDNVYRELSYGEKVQPAEVPAREGFEFKGWFADEALTNEFDFDTELKDNYTVVYGKWEQMPVTPEDPEDPSNPDNPNNPDDPNNPDGSSSTSGSNDTPAQEVISSDVAPETGDNAPIWILIAIMIGAAAVAIAVRKTHISNTDKLE